MRKCKNLVFMTSLACVVTVINKKSLFLSNCYNDRTSVNCQSIKQLLKGA